MVDAIWGKKIVCLLNVEKNMIQQRLFIRVLSLIMLLLLSWIMNIFMQIKFETCLTALIVCKGVMLLYAYRAPSDLVTCHSQFMPWAFASCADGRDLGNFAFQELMPSLKCSEPLPEVRASPESVKCCRVLNWVKASITGLSNPCR